MGWTGVTELVRCHFPTGFECEGHSLVSSRPQVIGNMIVFHVKRTEKTNTIRIYCYHIPLPSYYICKLLAP